MIVFQHIGVKVDMLFYCLFLDELSLCLTFGNLKNLIQITRVILLGEGNS